VMRERTKDFIVAFCLMVVLLWVFK
jgi:hypothetical protein